MRHKTRPLAADMENMIPWQEAVFIVFCNGIAVVVYKNGL
ncbi:hypothetical protein CPTD_01016 [Corynebacterium pseudotuberculosis]|nr:Hypothetical protein BFF96_0011 [Corynebacterium pseudotuberculosis]AUY59399.1 Hypothetical protein BFG00_0011 [Corynebacterium pseudotuberculosis]KEX89278.1 hypothetical protein CPTD_01016 [Corynebacterium pseudotuberculosis]